MNFSEREQFLLSYLKSFALSEEYEITENFASEMLKAGFTDKTDEGLLFAHLRKAYDSGKTGIKASDSPYISK